MGTQESIRQAFRQSQTEVTPFHDLPAEECTFFSVNGGITARFVLTEAENIDLAIKDIVGHAVESSTPVPISVCWLLELCTEMSLALRASVGAANL